VLTKGLAVLHTLPETPQRPERKLSLQIALDTSLTATKSWAAPEEARQLLAPIDGWFTEAVDTADLQEAGVLL